MSRSRLDRALDKILADDETDEWTDLVAATVRLGTALARWDNAEARYAASKAKHQLVAPK